MELHDKIYVAGHTGLVGSAIVRKLESLGYDNIVKSYSADVDLRRQEDTYDFFRDERPEYVFLSAATVGGIQYNMNNNYTLLNDNLEIQSNVIGASRIFGVKKLLFLGSSCIYPRNAEQPFKESSLLTGPLEPTNEGYAVAKIAGIKQCEYLNREGKLNAVSVIPANVYGPGGKWHPGRSHVVTDMINKIYQAKTMGVVPRLLGDGSARRELLYVDDLADACVFLMNNYSATGPINVGTDAEASMVGLALMISFLLGYEGPIEWGDKSTNGMPRKKVDTSRLEAIGWRAETSLIDGLKATVESELSQYVE
jgi:GDP-L-fucose synthase